MHGWIEGDRFITELLGGPPVQLRMTWELLSDGTVR